jgi:hypothetical protein
LEPGVLAYWPGAQTPHESWATLGLKVPTGLHRVRQGQAGRHAGMQAGVRLRGGAYKSQRQSVKQATSGAGGQARKPQHPHAQRAHQAVKTTAAVLFTKVPAGEGSQLVPATEL